MSVALDEPLAPTHCPYCSLQCGIHVTATQRGHEISGNTKFPVNSGRLCVKGWSAGALLDHPERLLHPLVRNDHRALVRATWDEALDRIARGFECVQRRYGRDAVGVFGGGSLTNEKAYLLGKFARVALETSNIDYNGRFCMSSAAAASVRAFGLDRGLPFPLADIADARAILLVGSNAAETMPPVMQYFEAQLANGGRLLVADPRRSLTAQWATRHLALRPGSDAALANGLLHVLIRDRLIDAEYIDQRTEGFENVRHLVAAYWPERVERLTGVPEPLLIETAHILGEAESAMILTSRGPEQQAHGVDNTLAYINVALAIGAVGRPFSGYGCLTGQGNGQGGREHGQKADQLPGYRHIGDQSARDHVAKVWEVSPSAIPGPGKSAFELLDSLGRDGGVRGLLVMGSNVAVSAPDSLSVGQRLASLDLLVVADFFLSETAAYADVVLPSAQWAEEEGTLTNLEGRVIHRCRAVDPPADVRTDLEILIALAARLGKERFFSYEGPEAVFEELRRATSGGPADYTGITYERLRAEPGVFWPCPAPHHPGTPRMFIDRFSTATGRARFHAVHYHGPAEDRDAVYPLFLTTGRVLAQYQSGAQTRRIAPLRELVPEAVAEVHPTTARLARLVDNDRVKLVTRRGTATFRLKVTNSIREDTVFIPFHWGDEQCANRLTNPALDPVSRMPEFKVCAVRVEGEVGGES
jgi:assimilatory nitrate reductase catalytic subunit